LEDARADAGFEAVLADEVHLAAEKLLQLADEGGMGQKAASGLEFDEQVEIALGSGGAARDRAKYTHVFRPVACGQGQDFLPPLVYGREAIHAGLLNTL